MRKLVFLGVLVPCGVAAHRKVAGRDADEGERDRVADREDLCHLDSIVQLYRNSPLRHGLTADYFSSVELQRSAIPVKEPIITTAPRPL